MSAMYSSLLYMQNNRLEDARRLAFAAARANRLGVRASCNRAMARNVPGQSMVDFFIELEKHDRAANRRLSLAHKLWYMAMDKLIEGGGLR